MELTALDMSRMYPPTVRHARAVSPHAERPPGALNEGVESMYPSALPFIPGAMWPLPTYSS
eukprot:scaffold140672_cov76-Cyclotella_meneghiniana.AAC.7